MNTLGSPMHTEDTGKLPRRSPYTPHHSLDELEAVAHATNDTATLAVIALAEEAAGLALEDARERRADKLCDARGVTGMRAKLDALVAENARLQRLVSDARELESAVRFVLHPFIAKTAPKWAVHLRATLRHISERRA